MDEAKAVDLSPELAEAMEAARSAHAQALADGIIEEPEAEEEFDSLGEVAGGEPPVTRRGVDALVCVYCLSPIPSVRLAYRKVVGWEKQRAQGGTNAVRLRQSTDEYACRVCVDAIAAGRDPAQGAML